MIKKRGKRGQMNPIETTEVVEEGFDKKKLIYITSALVGIVVISIVVAFFVLGNKGSDSSQSGTAGENEASAEESGLEVPAGGDSGDADSSSSSGSSGGSSSSDGSGGGSSGGGSSTSTTPATNTSIVDATSDGVPGEGLFDYFSYVGS